MNTLVLKSLVAVLLSISFLGIVDAQQERFPETRVQPKSCSEVAWNENMLVLHPKLVDACREVVTIDGTDWARFEAKFLGVESDGRVNFTIRDRRDRIIEQVTLKPAPGQVAYIDDRATPFANLRQDQQVNLYVPEGQYGFSTRPGVPVDQVAVVAPDTTPATAPARTAQARPEQRATMLPATAGSLPLLALGGMMALLAALGLTVARRL